MNILITGPSGSGKSTIGKALRKLGYGFIEADVDTCDGKSIAYWTGKTTKRGRNMPWPQPENWHNENNWTWRVDTLNQKITESRANADVVFVCGDSYNKTEAYKLFDKIFVLSAKDDVLNHRVELRTDHDFGKKPAQLAWILKENKHFTKDLTDAGAISINADKSVGQIVNEILHILGLDN